MSGSAKSGFGFPPSRAASALFAAMWDAPVPALKPLGAARVIQSWEAPGDLWRKKPAEPAAVPGAIEKAGRGG